MVNNKKDCKSLRKRIINLLMDEKVVFPERKSPKDYGDIDVLDVRGSFDVFR